MLVLSTGSNLEDKLEYLKRAKQLLSERFKFCAESKVFTSKAVDYLNQPDFLNQILEFELPQESPDEVMKTILSIEKSLGRVRKISKGPRTIDIDIIFWGTESFKTENVCIPHPSWHLRSFIALPIKQIPYFEVIKEYFDFPQSFDNSARELIV
jgi:2-amino-4-hydroxy-6-hydroxymethyldihydropteridine diphosphokinase